MNKRAKRRAFFVCSLICVIYMSMAARIPEKMRFGRVVDGPGPMMQNVDVPMPGSRFDLSQPEQITKDGGLKTKSEDEPTLQQTPVSDLSPAVPPPSHLAHDGSSLEPSFLISVPIVCFAIKEGLIEKEGLIFIKKEGYNEANCKKPIDILKDRDEQGLRSISKIIGKKILLDLLKKEGITCKEELTAEDTMLGKGFVLEKKKLLSMYNAYVSEEYSGLFPFVHNGVGVAKERHGFELIDARAGAAVHQAKEDGEWLMPNLINLSMRAALEKLTAHTAKVRIHGSGDVVEQDPKPFERLHGEAECSIYGRTSKP